jgi:hypothetical protein
MRALLSLSIASVVCVTVPFAGTAFAQAGSTGGTLGNTDKSISGERREEPSSQQKLREPKPHATSSSCGKIAGGWKWDGGIVAIKTNGTAHHPTGGSGTWTCNNRQYVFSWSNGFTDHVTLSGDGNSLSGSNNMGYSFSASRL